MIIRPKLIRAGLHCSLPTEKTLAIGSYGEIPGNRVYQAGGEENLFRWYAPLMTVKIAPKSYALKALEVARKDLCRDKYLIPVAFVVMDDEILDFNLTFDDYEQKRSVYGELVKVAKAKNARAIITINDSTSTSAPGTESEESRQECIYLTVSGPNFQTWSVSVPYRRAGPEIVFEKAIESTTDVLNLLPGWTHDPTAS